MSAILSFYIFLGLPLILGTHALLQRQDSLFYHLVFAANILSLGVALCAGLGAGKRLSVLRAPLFFWSVIYLLYTLVQTMIFRETSAAIPEVKQIESIITLTVSLLPALAIGLLIRSWEHLRAASRMLDVALFALSASVLICALAFQFDYEFGEVLELSALPTRYFGPIGDQVGFVSALGLFLALGRARWSMMFFHLLAVILTGTRGLLPVIGVGILGYAYVVTHQSGLGSRSKNAIRLAGAILLIGGVLLSPVGEIVTERITDRALLEAGVSTRGGAMLLAVEIINEHPWFGVGYSGFTAQAIQRGAHLAFANFNSVYISNAQNPYLDAAVSGGLVGLALYLMVLWSTVKNTGHGFMHAPGDLYPTLMGLKLWLVSIIIGLQSACIVLPLSVILLFVGLAAMLVASTRWLAAEQSHNTRNTSLGQPVSSIVRNTDFMHQNSVKQNPANPHRSRF